MNIYTRDHICPECNLSWEEVSCNGDASRYAKMCHTCLELKVEVLEQKINMLYKFFDTVEAVKIR